MGCPKQMVFGPCGGVRDDGRCELADHPCTFLDTAPAHLVAGRPHRHRPGDGRPGRGVGWWAGRRSSLLAAATSPPVVLTDLTVEPFAPRSVRRVTERSPGPATRCWSASTQPPRPAPDA